MGVLIHLAAASPASPASERVFYADGRSLDAHDFERQDAYIDDRLLGLRPGAAGVIYGLDVAYDQTAEQLVIGAGAGSGFGGQQIHILAPIALAWNDLVQAAPGHTIVDGVAQIADGAYLVLARALAFDGLDGPPPDPALQAPSDPMLDLRQDSFVEILLSASIGAAPPSNAPADLALCANALVGGMTMQSLAAAAGDGLPLAMALVTTVGGVQRMTLSRAAGRLPAQDNALSAMVLAQTRETIAAALTEPGADPTSPAWQAALRARFRFLPPAGELPVGMAPPQFSAPPFFPPGMAVFLQIVRASQAPRLLSQALGRPPLDLADATAEAVTLSLAVPDSAWSRDLIDLPRADPVLPADLHLAYARARAAQVTLRQTWITLYGGVSAQIAAQPQAAGFLMDADGSSQNLSYLLNVKGLPVADLLQAADLANQPIALLNWAAAKIAALTAAGAAPPVALPPNGATAASQEFFALGYHLADPEPAPADPAATNPAPAASDGVLAGLFASLPPHSAFADWTQALAATPMDAVLTQPLIDAGIFDAIAAAADRATALTSLLALPQQDDTQPGALLALATLQFFYAILTRVALAHERLLAGHGRLIALQRQHLDMMSTYVSALAGGVPSDGSGLSFTRIIPFFNLGATPAGEAHPGEDITTPITPPRFPRSFDTFATPSASVASAATRTLAPPQGPTAPNLGVSAMASRMAFTSATATPMAVSRILPAASQAGIAPEASIAAARLGASVDIAREVASETSAMSQTPPFTYQSPQYGSAAHITSGPILRQIAQTGLLNLRDQMTGLLGLTPGNLPPPTPSATPTPAPTPTTADSETAAYADTVNFTRALLGDIAQVEQNAFIVESAYLQMRDRIQSLEARIGQAIVAAAAARDDLRNAQAVAAKMGGDYAAAQQLVQEEANRVAAALALRQQALAAATGLFFQRELQTLVSAPPLSGLALIGDSPDDLAPACPAGHAGPPAALQPFLALLQEAPLGDWRFLLPNWTDLPDVAGLARLASFRTARLANWTAPAYVSASAASADFTALAQTTRGGFDPLFRAAWTVSPSLAATQMAAFTILAPPDIILLPFGELRARAEALRARMESAAGCLFETLAALPPSIRFDLAARARAKTLPLLNFAQWPLPTTLDDATATTARRLAALADWFAGQMHDASSAAGRTALANLVAAAVMAAAYGDPNEAISGTVASSGGAPRPGGPIRIILNRPPPIGTILHIFDETQTLVGVVRVEDHDATGTTASVVNSFTSNAPNSGWSVAAPGGRAAWLPS